MTKILADKLYLDRQKRHHIENQKLKEHLKGLQLYEQSTLTEKEASDLSHVLDWSIGKVNKVFKRLKRIVHYVRVPTEKRKEKVKIKIKRKFSKPSRKIDVPKKEVNKNERNKRKRLRQKRQSK